MCVARYVNEYSLLNWAKQLGDMQDGQLPLVQSVSYGTVPPTNPTNRSVVSFEALEV